MTKRGKPSPAAKARSRKANKQRKKELKKKEAAPPAPEAAPPAPAPAPEEMAEPATTPPEEMAEPATTAPEEMAEPATTAPEMAAQLVVAATEALEAAFIQTPTSTSTDVSALELVTRERDQLKLEIVKLEQELDRLYAKKACERLGQVLFRGKLMLELAAHKCPKEREKRLLEYKTQPLLKFYKIE